MLENTDGLRDTQKRLCHITRYCNESMTEPNVEFLGTRGHVLDNAYHKDEVVIMLYCPDTGEDDAFNLADLIAMARMAHL